MIKLENVYKEYKARGASTPALKGVNLSIEKGEYVAIMGPSGSGKSTLLNIIGGMDVLSEGTYMFNDMNIGSMSPQQLHKFRKKYVSFVFQNFALMNHYTVFENAELPLIAQGMGKRKRKEIVERTLEEVGIADLKKKLPMSISGGQQQRCAIARALAAGTDLLLADEPTGALDSQTGFEIMDVFESINRSGKTILVVTHDINVAKRAKRVIHIIDGQVASDMPTEQLN
ncbi:MAG: ABC transporter ATP-binding protein [Lachnospiraceae bacterium]